MPPDASAHNNTAYRTFSNTVFNLRRYRIMMLIILFCPGYLLKAQGLADSLQLAKELRDKNDLKGSLLILSKCYISHPDDLNSAWLYAQTLYWDKQNTASQKTYAATIKKHPENDYLKLDYAKMLVAREEYAKAQPLLASYMQYDGKSEDLKTSLTTLCWQDQNAAAKRWAMQVYHLTADDTLNHAKQLKANGKLQVAFKLLREFHANHRSDFNSTWLYAQTAWWAGEFKTADKVYDEAIRLSPSNYSLKLEYAQMLVDKGNYEKAKPLLTAYSKFDPTNNDLHMAFTEIYLRENPKDKNAVAQFFKPSGSDTISVAKKLKSKGHLKAAMCLLTAYHANHANDLNSSWVYAQTAYWAGRLKKSKNIYNQLIQQHPDNYYLKLDYGKMLTEIAEYKRAKPVLTTYQSYDPTNLDLKLSLAKIKTGEGDFKPAEKEVKEILDYDRSNAGAQALLDEIHLAELSWVKIKALYSTDTQPLESINPSVEAGIFVHPEATIRFNLQAPVFIRDGSVFNAQWLQVGDESRFRKAGFMLVFDVGILKQTYQNKISWTANLELTQTVLKHLVFHLQAERKPYYYTRSSLDTSLLIEQYAANVGWDNLNSVNGKASFDYNQFPDKNHTLSASAWVFSPPLKISVFEFRVGYAYSFNTSAESRFTSEKTLAQILTNYDASAPITGVYAPYFTPDNMQIHAALASMVIHPAKIFDLGVNASIGFYATTLNPYLFLNLDNNNTIFIDRGFAPVKFTPIEVSAYGVVRITKLVSLKAEYGYHKTYFYTSNTAALGLKISFLNGKKGK